MSPPGCLGKAGWVRSDSWPMQRGLRAVFPHPCSTIPLERGFKGEASPPRWPQQLPITWMMHLLLQPHLGGAEAGGVTPGPIGQDGDVVYLRLHVVEQRGLDVLQGAGLAVPMLQVLHPLGQAVVPAGRLLVLRAGRKVGWGGCLGSGTEPGAWPRDPPGMGRQGSKRAEERSLHAPTETKDPKDSACTLTLTLQPHTNAPAHRGSHRQLDIPRLWCRQGVHGQA